MKKEISNHAAVAKALKQYCKANNIPCRARSESYSGGSSVTVYVSNLPPVQYEKLVAYANQFKYGSFDGMTDSYNFDSARNRDIPHVYYVFVENEISDELRQMIYDFVKANYSGMEDAPADAKEGARFHNKIFCEDASTLVYRLFRGGYNQNDFWVSRTLKAA